MHNVLSDAESQMSFCKDFWCTAILDTTDNFVFEEAALIIVYCIFHDIYRKGKKSCIIVVVLQNRQTIISSSRGIACHGGLYD